MSTRLREPEPLPRVAPANAEAEQHLLGAVLCDNSLLDCAEILRPEHFYNAMHGRIFEAVRKFIDRGDVADPVTLKPIFDQDPALQEVGGVRYLAQLASAGVFRAARVEVEQLTRIMYDCALRRELILLTEEATTVAYRDPFDPAKEQIERLEAGLRRLAESGQTGAGFQRLSATTERALEIALDAFKRGDKLAGVTTGFADLDKALRGLHRSDLVILAGRPSMGKTALAENIARNAAKFGKSVGFFSLEMANEQLGSRVLAGESGIPADWVRRADLNQQHFDKLCEAKRQTDDLPLYIDDTPGLSVDAMHARARRWKRQHGLDLIVIDYLQLAQAPSPEGRRDQNRVQEVSEITARSKRLAKDLGVPVLALSQLSRAVEGRDDKRPLLSDLRDSGSIEQDADVVMFLFREEYYLREPDVVDNAAWTKWRDKQQAVHGKAELIIAKNRHGPTTTVQLRFDKATTQFSNLARGFEQ